MASPEREVNSTQLPPIGAELAAAICEVDLAAFPEPVRQKAQGCLADFLACAMEAADLPWGQQLIAYGKALPAGGASVVGQPLALAAAEAALVNGGLGHGLVREDMHVASCCHLGVVVWPTLLALAQTEKTSADLLGCAVIGYEIGAALGRQLFDAQLAAQIRPTGTIGAMAGAAAAARLLGLDQEETRNALSLAANMAAGVNEWPWVGGTEVVLHAGLAARNAVTAVLLARTGFFASPTAIEGRAGLFAAYGRREKAATVKAFAGAQPEIMDVYWKPVPACNYVQTPCQVAAEVAAQLRSAGLDASSIASVEIGSFPHAVEYPGCNQPGPFPGVLEAKMSLQYSVSAVLVSGRIGEANYRNLKDPEVLRLASQTNLSLDQGFTDAYPAKQGARVTAVLTDGRRFTAEAAELVAVDHPGVMARMQSAVDARMGQGSGAAFRDAVETLIDWNDPLPLFNALASKGVKG